MKHLKKIVLFVITFCICLLNIKAAEPEKTYAYQQNDYLCNNQKVSVEGCYFDAKSAESEKNYGDLKDETVVVADPNMMMADSVLGKMSDTISVKSAKFMQAYTVFNNEQKAVLGLCYKGYVSQKFTQNFMIEGGGYYTNEMVSTKDGSHTVEVIILKVVEPNKKDKCVSSKTQAIYGSDFKITVTNIPSVRIDTAGYEGYKSGSCPTYFNFTSSLKGLALWAHSDKEFTFSDSKDAEWKKGFLDSLLSTDYSGKITGCTEKDVEGEEFSAACYENKIAQAKKYVCPANIKDFNLDLGDYINDCDPLKQTNKDLYSYDYDSTLAKENAQKVKNAYNEKYEECSESGCGLTASEIASVNAKLKGTVCQYGCILGEATTTQNDGKEGKCIACGGSQGVTYKWVDKDSEVGSGCSVANLTADKCFGNSSSGACRACYTTAYSGLSEDKKTCLMNQLEEKSSTLTAHNEEVDKKFDEKVTSDMEEASKTREKIYNNSFSMFEIPGMGDGGFGKKGQKCSEILKTNGMKIVKGIINIIRIGGAILAIVNAMITLIPAVIAKDADGLKKAGRKLVVMAVVLAIIGILPSIIYLIGLLFGYDLSCIF